jgi:hypothetical protein
MEAEEARRDAYRAHEKMEKGKALKSGKLNSTDQPLLKGVEGEVGGPHTMLIPCTILVT